MKKQDVLLSIAVYAVTLSSYIVACGDINQREILASDGHENQPPAEPEVLPTPTPVAPRPVIKTVESEGFTDNPSQKTPEAPPEPAPPGHPDTLATGNANQPSPKNDTVYPLFSQNCEKRSELNPERQKTVRVVLGILGTANCSAAQEKLYRIDSVEIVNSIPITSSRLAIPVSAQVSDLSVIGALPNVLTLTLIDSAISDLAFASYLTNLTTVTILNNQEIRDLAPITNLSNLTRLNLSNTPKIDYSAIAEATGLKALDLLKSGVDDISFLSYLYSLESLNLTGNRIEDIGPISDLTKLKSLILTDNKITRATQLSKLLFLQTLDLSSNQITELSGLSMLPLLKDLNIADNAGLSNLLKIGSVPTVTTLNISGIPITSLVGIIMFPSLKSLTASRTKIQSLTFLSAIPALSKLETLVFDDAGICWITGLEKLTSLKVLSIRNNRLFTPQQRIPLSTVSIPQVTDTVRSENDMDTACYPVRL